MDQWKLATKGCMLACNRRVMKTLSEWTCLPPIEGSHDFHIEGEGTIWRGLGDKRRQYSQYDISAQGKSLNKL